MFTNLRQYLFHTGIKTNDQDIKEYLNFQKITKEERYPLSSHEYRRIVEGFSRYPRYQALFLALGSSGMRIGEALNLKKKDLDLSQERIKVNIPPTTKTRTARATYLSDETAKILKPLIDKHDNNDYVFVKKGSVPNQRSINMSLSRVLHRMGFTEKYQSNGHMKITSHSFRAFFFTKAARKHGENYAHRLTGHGGYLIQYDRMTEDEKLEKYMELEPDLFVFDQTKNEFEIKKLKRENTQVEKLEEELLRLKEIMSQQDKRILQKLMENGNIPELKFKHD